MRRLSLLTLVFALILVTALPAAAGTFHERRMPAGDDPDSRPRDYQVYLPDGLDAGAAPAMVVVLHGCRQNERNMIDETRFTELADAHGFVAVFPFVTGYDELRIENCWGFWFPQHRHEGRGEVGDLRRIVDRVENAFGTNPDRRYITGLSSGAAMAVVAAVAYSEDFAAAGAVAGLPYGEDAAAVGFACGLPTQHHGISRIVGDMQAEQRDPAEQRVVPMLVIHSLNDCTVPIRNGLNIRDSWIRHHGAEPEPAEVRDCTTEGVSCRHSRYTDAGGTPVVETVLYGGPTSGRTHYWPGDNAGPFADPTGPSASELLWGFFQDKSLAPGVAADIRINDARVEGTRIVVGGTADSAGAAIARVGVRLDGEMPRAEQDAAGTATWSTAFAELPADRFYTPVARLVLEDGAEKLAFGPRLAVGTPVEVTVATGTWQQHLAAGRIAVQQDPCATAGLLGACDSDFTTLFFEHQFAPFPLYAATEAGPWYAREDNVRAGSG